MLNRLSDHPLFAETAPGRSVRADPLGFIDVGAHGGVHSLAAPLARHTATLAFEPNPQSFAALQQTIADNQDWAAVEAAPVAIGGISGPASLHLLTVPTNDSLRPPNPLYTDRYAMEKWRQTGEITVETTTLDTVVFAPAHARYRFGEVIKLDTQGTEHEILRAGLRTLRERCVAVFTEVSFCQLYEGQATFSDIDHLLRGEGFSFYGFGLAHTRSTRRMDKARTLGKERIIQADAIFLKDPLSTPPARPADARQAHILFLAALLLGYPDFALELAEKTWADGAEYGRIVRLVDDLAAAPPLLAARAVDQLAAAVAATPSDANLLVGKFVDPRREWWDCKEITSVSLAGTKA